MDISYEKEQEKNQIVQILNNNYTICPRLYFYNNIPINPKDFKSNH